MYDILYIVITSCATTTPSIQSPVTSAINIADCIRFQSPFGSNPICGYLHVKCTPAGPTTPCEAFNFSDFLRLDRKIS